MPFEPNNTNMALWEYKVITSGPHGFASPALLEAHLNALGKDEWEIIHFQTLPNNALAFHGLARRSTTRDWSPPIESVVAAPTRPAPESAPIKPAASVAKTEPETLASRIEEKSETPEPVREETLRPMRNTEHDLDPDAEEEEDWDNWEEDEDELPTFFEALKPHLRRNQKGPGMSVAVDYLAKRWDQREADLVGALKECGFTIPESEESDPEYFEFEGDLYWINRNNRGLLFINTREKPRPVFRTAPAKKLSSDDPSTAELVAERAAEKAEIDKRKQEKQERAERQAAQAAAAAAARESGPAVADQPDSPGTEGGSENPNGSTEPLPTGEGLLDRLRPLMRRNRRGPGISGSIGYLARALHHNEGDLLAALSNLGLQAPTSPNDKAVNVEIGPGIYWMNRDNRGGVWINGRENRNGGQRSEAKPDPEMKPAEETAAIASAAESSAEGAAATSDTAPGSTGSVSTDASSVSEASGNTRSDAATEVAGATASATASSPAGTSSGESESKSEETDENAEPAKRATKGKSTRRSGARPRTRKAKTDSSATTTSDEESPGAKDEAGES